MVHPDAVTISYVVDTLASMLIHETTVEGLKTRIKNLIIYLEAQSNTILKTTMGTSENCANVFNTSEYIENERTVTSDNYCLNNVMYKDRTEFQNVENPPANDDQEEDMSDASTDVGEFDYSSDETIDADQAVENPIVHIQTDVHLGEKNQELSLRDPVGKSRVDAAYGGNIEGIKTETHEPDVDQNEGEGEDIIEEGVASEDQTNSEMFKIIKREIGSNQVGVHRFPNSKAEGDQSDNVKYYYVLGGSVNGLYKCTVCEKEFERPDLLDKHCWSEHRLKPDLKCKFCNIEFPHRRAFRQHKRYACPEKARKRKHPCRVCLKEFTKKRHAISHEYLHRGERPFVCEVCGKSYRSNDVLKIHMNNAHLGNGKHYCEICGKSFSTKSSLQTHIRQHTDNFSFRCEICDKGFHGRQGLERHMNSVHLKERNYTCETCGQSFFDNNNLNRHIKSHTETERVICTYCGKDVCVRHYKRHILVHTTDKKYICTQCDKSFLTLNYLKLHQISHTKERPHKCSVCSKSFSTKSKLKIHENIHSGLKPFVCEICGKSSADRSNYYKHKKIHK